MQHQAGATLVVSMIILLIVTILGVSSLTVSTLEEKMAASSRNHDLAFQAAESALRAAEGYIDDNNMNDTNFSDNCQTVAGLCTQVSAEATLYHWQNPDFCGAGQDIWQCNSSVAVSGSDALSTTTYASQPRYFIEVLQNIGAGGYEDLNQGNVGDEETNGQVTYYRITALGYGGTSDSTVLLQTTYGK